jgi:hypothetical protein
MNSCRLWLHLIMKVVFIPNHKPFAQLIIWILLVFQFACKEKQETPKLDQFPSKSGLNQSDQEGFTRFNDSLRVIDINDIMLPQFFGNTSEIALPELISLPEDLEKLDYLFRQFEIQKNHFVFIIDSLFKPTSQDRRLISFFSPNLAGAMKVRADRMKEAAIKDDNYLVSVIGSKSKDTLYFYQNELADYAESNAFSYYNMGMGFFIRQNKDKSTGVIGTYFSGFGSSDAASGWVRTDTSLRIYDNSLHRSLSFTIKKDGSGQFLLEGRDEDIRAEWGNDHRVIFY